jgi:hypothetical protein
MCMSNMSVDYKRGRVVVRLECCRRAGRLHWSESSGAEAEAWGHQGTDLRGH